MKPNLRIRFWSNLLSLAACLLVLPVTAAFAQGAAPKVRINTSMGAIVVELDPQHAPKTVENFLRYVREGFYSGIVIHRIVPGFVIQGGGMDLQGRERDTHDPIALETATSTSNVRGTIAMARTSNPNSADSQFFINLQDNSDLDREQGDPGNLSGYTVFGHVTDGMSVVDTIAMQPLGGRFGGSSPATPVVIEGVTVVN